MSASVLVLNHYLQTPNILIIWSLLNIDVTNSHPFCPGTRFSSIHCPLEIWQHNEDNTGAVAVFSGYTGYHLALTWDWELARDWEGVSGVCWAGRLQGQEAVSLPPSRHRQPHSDYLLQISSDLGSSCLGRGDQHSMIYVHWCWRVFPLLPIILFLNWFLHILASLK